MSETVKTCPSLSGKATLTYKIISKDKEVFFGLVENTEGGLFSKEALSLKEMVPAKEKPITGASLNKLFKGGSINSGGFMLAILRHENLVESIEGKRGRYITKDPKAFVKSLTPKKVKS